MLIDCPECSHRVSDKAFSCPLCGFPIAKTNILSTEEEKPLKKANTRSRKFRKLPNGTGSVYMLTGKRRKPFVAYPPVTEHKVSGSPVHKKAIGYFETYNEAYAALIQYNNDSSIKDRSEITFKEVYERWWKEKFEDPMSDLVFSESTKRNYKWAFMKCESIHNKPMQSIFKDDMQSLIDSLKLSYSSARNLHNLLSGMYRYAYENGIVEKDYSDFISIKQKREFEKGVPFTADEINKLWENKKNSNVRIALILIYTGMRITELKTCNIDMENHIFVGGVKTKAGKNRTIPMHKKIIPLVEEFDQESFSVGNYQDKLFHKTLSSLGFGEASTGEKHTPHDCRHTFSWLADKYHMDDLSKRLIMGHSLGKDVEKNTYGHRTVEELTAEINKIC